jgi:ribosome-associated toxin RatA of RatAB toxin-antitoxin module
MNALRSRSRDEGRNGHFTDYRGRAVVLATVLVLGLSMAAEQVPAATITITAQRIGDAIDIKASALLKTDTTTAWRVLTDYDRYPEFIPDLRMSRVIARRGTTVTVEQSGDAALWLLRIPVDITYEITESPPNRLDSHAIGGSLRVLASSYVLTPTELGARLDYSGHIAPGYQLLGRIEQIAVRRNVARQFQALADEIERRSAGAEAQSADASR